MHNNTQQDLNNDFLHPEVLLNQEEIKIEQDENNWIPSTSSTYIDHGEKGSRCIPNQAQPLEDPYQTHQNLPQEHSQYNLPIYQQQQHFSAQPNKHSPYIHSIRTLSESSVNISQQNNHHHQQNLPIPPYQSYDQQQIEMLYLLKTISRDVSTIARDMAILKTEMLSLNTKNHRFEVRLGDIEKATEQIDQRLQNASNYVGPQSLTPSYIMSPPLSTSALPNQSSTPTTHATTQRQSSDTSKLFVDVMSLFKENYDTLSSPKDSDDGEQNNVIISSPVSHHKEQTRGIQVLQVVEENTNVQPTNPLLASGDNNDGLKTNGRKRKLPNPCSTFIRRQLEQNFSEEELSTCRASHIKRKYKDTTIVNSPLSPTRLNRILFEAKVRFTQEQFQAMGGVNEVVNTKCRQVLHKIRLNKPS